MGLLHWWPLNGNLDDIGLKSAPLSSSGTSSISSGKIGSCYKITSALKINNAINELNYANTSVSFGGWFKFNQSEIASVLTSSIVNSASTTPTGNLIGNNSYGGFGLVWESNNIYSSGSFSSIRFYPYLRKSSQSIYATSSAYTVNFDTWYHFMVVLDIVNKKILFYVNGSLHSSTTYSTAIEYESHEYYINQAWVGGGNGPGKSIPLYANDIRMYDHALSAKEVKELSKALVLHYDFEDPYTESTTNLFGGRTDFSVTSKWPRSQINSTAPTINSDGDMVLYGYATDGNHQSYTVSSQGGYTTISPSTTYTLSVYVKYSSTDAYFNMYFYERTDSASVKTNSWRIGCTADEVGRWVLRSKTITTQSTTTKMYTELNCYNCPSTEYIIMKNNTVQLEAKDHATPFTGDTRSNELLYDCSGYGRHATQINNPQFVLDSGSGQYSASLLDNTKGYFDMGTATLNFITSGTVVFWAKYVSDNYKMLFGANDSGSKYYLANTPNGSSSGGNWYSSNGGSQGTAYCDGTAYTKPKCDSQWHCYAFTGVNFSGWGDLKYFLCKYANNESNSFQFHGYLSDLKVYATALSVDDIKLECQRKASIDRAGNFFTGEVIEYPTANNLLELANYNISTIIGESCFDGHFSPITKTSYDASYPNSSKAGIGRYTQGNLSVTMTEHGIRIYSKPNWDGRAISGSGWDTWGGLCLSPMKNSNCLFKGHRYVLSWHVKGQSSASMSEVYFSSQVGWGTSTTNPSTTTNKLVTQPSNFIGEMDCHWDFTINDDIWKVCTNNDGNSSFTVGTTYLSYAAIKLGYGYRETGELGTDITISNIKLHDITANKTYKVDKNNFILTTEVDSGKSATTKVFSGGGIKVNELYEK